MDIMHRIVNNLVLHSSFFKEVGLFHGRIGISIVLYHYARYIKDPLYEEFGGILLDDVLESIPNDINIGLENGISGIGWAVCHLLNNNFVEGDAIEVLRLIDERILEYEPLRMNDYSLENGLEGIAVYMLERNKLISSKQDIRYPKSYLYNIEKQLMKWIWNKNYTVRSFINKQSMARISLETFSYDLGLHNGYAGKLMSMITT
jgi:hypothetical protein